MDEGDEIARTVLEEFRRLPSKRKPAVRDNGLHEWVPLSGIVAKGPGFINCIALATGMKCLPASKLAQSNGVAIHDWHAEILALRAFNLFILQECQHLTQGAENSDFLIRRTNDKLDASSSTAQPLQPFTWNQAVTLHMYCSEAPCGDASMELIMAAQADASPWDIPTSTTTTPTPETAPPTQDKNDTPPPSLPGRAYFSQLGIVRRKPARGDAPPTLSKSCSDKIALKQATSLLTSLTSLLVSPEHIYLASLVLPESQHSPVACERCFSSRMSSLAGRVWEGGYAFTPFRVETTGQEFEYSKREVARRAERTSASNLAVMWTGHGTEEGIVGGVLQGRRQFDLKGASMASRRGMWKLAAGIAGLLDGIPSSLAEGTYDELKMGTWLELRRAVKDDVRHAMKGWVRNTEGGGFTLL